MTTILYDGVNPFSGIAPTPLVSRSARMISYGNRWGQTHTITLRGTLTGDCNDTTEQMLARQQALISGFSRDYQTLILQDDVTPALTYQNVKVADITFDASTYAQSLLPFAVELEIYPEDYFSGQFGIIQPNNEVDYSEGDDGIVQVRHTTSARGFNTSSAASNAYDNAEAWVNARTGLASSTLPHFINLNSGLCLRSVKKSINRLAGSYEVVEDYSSDIYREDGILRYTSSFQSGVEEGVSTVQVEGNLQGCLNQTIETLRNGYLSFNAFNEAVQHYRRETSLTDLNSIPLTKQVSEDSTHKVIGFSYTFTNDLRPKTNIIYELGFSYNFDEDIISVNVQATISSKGPYSTTKWNEVKAIANQVNLYSIAAPAYLNYVEMLPDDLAYLSSYQLNPNPTQTSRTENEFGTAIVLSASFSNSVIPPNGLQAFDYSLNFAPSLNRYAANPILDGAGQYYIFDLGFASRASCQVEASAIGAETTSLANTQNIVKSELAKIHSLYFTGTKKVMDNQNFVSSIPSSVDGPNFVKKVSASAAFSAEQEVFTI